MRQLRILSGIKPRQKAGVIGQSLDLIVSRYMDQIRMFRDLIPPNFAMAGVEACEVGPGDGLANAALLLGLGARHIDLVELQPAVTSAKQVEVLQALIDQGVPVDLDLIRGAPSFEFNSDKVTYYRMFMDDLAENQKYSLVYSFCVGEHVEDLGTFFGSCYRATKPGGLNIHVIDLGGHGLFEDPLPPLDFQTYPDWLYRLMYPPFYRSTRRFVGEYLQAFESAGFIVEGVRRLREVDPAYVTSIRPHLRAVARAVPQEDISLIEFAVILRRPE